MPFLGELYNRLRRVPSTGLGTLLAVKFAVFLAYEDVFFACQAYVLAS